MKVRKVSMWEEQTNVTEDGKSIVAIDTHCLQPKHTIIWNVGEKKEHKMGTSSKTAEVNDRNIVTVVKKPVTPTFK